MAKLTPRQRWAVGAPAVGIVLLGAGAFAWLAAGWYVVAVLAVLLGIGAIAWGIAAQLRDPVLRNRSQPTMKGEGGREGTR